MRVVSEAWNTAAVLPEKCGHLFRAAEQPDDLIDHVLAGIPPPAEDVAEDEARATRVCVIGRPNVGKSTLINRLLGEERMIATDQPGTTRDTVMFPSSAMGRPTC